LKLFACDAVGAVSTPAESEADFRARLAHEGREKRDAAVEEIRQQFAPKLASLQQRLRASTERVAREQQQLGQQATQAAISLGATVLGALFGRRSVVGSIGRATTAARGATRAYREHEDVSRAQDDTATLQQELAGLQSQLDQQAAELARSLDPASVELRPLVLPPKKSDITVATIAIAWVPVTAT